MNFFEEKWYVDRMDIKRLQSTKNGSIEKQTYETIKENVKCKIYNSSQPPIDNQGTGAMINENNKVAFPVGTDVIMGDELTIYRYGKGTGERYIAGKPMSYEDLVGGVKTGLHHMQCAITLKERNN